MLSVVCWKIPNCNSHHSTSSQNKAKSFSFHQCRRNFLPLSYPSFRGASSFCFNEQIWVANVAFTTWLWICPNLCVHLFSPECKVFHWISRTCLTTLCLLVFSHIFVFAKIVIASAAAAVCCIIIVPLCETTIAQTRGRVAIPLLFVKNTIQSQINNRQKLVSPFSFYSRSEEHICMMTFF